MAVTEIEQQLSVVVSNLPGVRPMEKLGHISFMVGKKVFAFTKSDALVLKLPSKRIAELKAEGKAVALIMGKRMMKEWAVLKYGKPADVKKDLQVFKEALFFVRGGVNSDPR